MTLRFVVTVIFGIAISNLSAQTTYNYYTVKYDQNGNELWADTIDVGGGDDYAYDVATDGSGNVIVTGAAPTISLHTDYYTVKYDANGNILWSDTIDLGDIDEARGVATDAAGNIIVTGSATIAGNLDYYTVKYDPDGNILWTDAIDLDGGDDYAEDVATDALGNIVVAGYARIGIEDYYYTVKYDPNGTMLWSDTMDVMPGYHDWLYGVATDALNNIVVTGSAAKFGSGSAHYYTVKYNPSGGILWTDSLEIGLGSISYGVAVDGSNNIVITGYCDDAASRDWHTVKYDPTGTNILWRDTIDVAGDWDTGYAAAIDKNDNVIVTGSSKTGGNYSDYYTVKYDPDGNLLWSDTVDLGDQDDAHGVATDADNNIVVTGYVRTPPPTSVKTISLDAISRSYEIELKWSFESSNDVFIYLIKRSVRKKNTYSEIARITGAGSSPSSKNYYYKDRDVKAGVRYYYKLGIVRIDGNTLWYGPVSAMVTGTKPFLSISPNPFTQKTVIRYSLSATNDQLSMTNNLQYPALQIYDASGRLIRSFPSSLFTRRSSVTWDGRDERGKRVTPGIYFIKLRDKNISETQKLIFAK